LREDTELTTYLIRRFIQGFLVLFLASFVIYTLLMITPGGPQDQINSSREGRGGGMGTISQSYIESLETAYKLQRYKEDGPGHKAGDLVYPWPTNYLAWLFDTSERATTDIDQMTQQTITKGIDVSILGMRIKGNGVLTGDFGSSINIARGVPVMTMMGDVLGNTLALTISAQLITILVAIPIGIIAAVRQYSKLDYTVTAFSFVGIAMPTFWMGLMLIIFLAVIPKQLNVANNWPWLPYFPPGNVSDTGREGEIINRIYHLVLPVSVLAFFSIAGLSRFVRASMLEVLRQDYVRTAWAKGLAQRAVILKHALRNALIPVITIVTLGLPGLVSGAIITETVFNYAGMGQLYAKAVFQLDIPLVMGFLLIITALIVLTNILADVLFAVADPRIRFS
jgi:peptide/nickel transport system permease protein